MYVYYAVRNGQKVIIMCKIWDFWLKNGLFLTFLELKELKSYISEFKPCLIQHFKFI